MSDKQKRFISEYLVDLNATQAAIRAGYSVDTAGAIGCENLTKPEIQAAIADAMRAREERTSITAEKVLREYARIAFFDAAKLFDEEGDPLRIHDIDADTRAAIAGLDVQEMYEESVNTGRIKKYRIANKLGALDSVAKHLGMFTEKVDVTTDGKSLNLSDDERAARIAAILDRAREMRDRPAPGDSQ